MPHEGPKALPHVYVKYTILSDAEPFRLVTLLNVDHPGVEDTCVKRTKK